MSAALARLPSTLEDLLRGLGAACVVCGEQTETEERDGLHVAACPSCGSVLEHEDAPPLRRMLRLVP